MRLVVWNCWRGLSGERWELLSSLEPDIAVIPEAEQVVSLPAGAAGPSAKIWAGQNPTKGLCVMSFGEWSVEPDPEGPRVPWVQPVLVRGTADFMLLAIWTVVREGWPNYARQVAEAVDAYREELSSGGAVLAGDFNCAPQTADPRPHLANVAALQDLGLESAYHLAEGIEHGDESIGTLYWRWQRDQPFHCDFAFVPRRWEAQIRSVRVGGFDEWVAAKASDHVPVLLDLSF